jgi:hypothetical protein
VLIQQRQSEQMLSSLTPIALMNVSLSNPGNSCSRGSHPGETRDGVQRFVGDRLRPVDQ